MTEWHPIAEAPTDGSEFLARGYNWGDENRGEHTVVAKWLAPKAWPGFASGNFVSACNEHEALRYLREWQPIP